MHLKVAKRINLKNLKSSHHKRKFCNYVCGLILTGLMNLPTTPSAHKRVHKFTFGHKCLLKFKIGKPLETKFNNDDIKVHASND